MCSLLISCHWWNIFLITEAVGCYHEREWAGGTSPSGVNYDGTVTKPAQPLRLPGSMGNRKTSWKYSCAPFLFASSLVTWAVLWPRGKQVQQSYLRFSDTSVAPEHTAYRVGAVKLRPAVHFFGGSRIFITPHWGLWRTRATSERVRGLQNSWCNVLLTRVSFLLR